MAKVEQLAPRVSARTKKYVKKQYHKLRRRLEKKNLEEAGKRLRDFLRGYVT